ncbi:DUF1648 domain-containing protein [Microbacterium suaedae]|uniref:DUF1648 domain-containing protein n=1 Tax=Microbacterium suaedae TaxID=2067813 RepID=UPI000DA1A53A|nr:DUF1648 domain-containing protein [Microbacterium suaedae]
MTRRSPAAGRRFRLVAVWLPTAVTALAVSVQLVALPFAPITIAVHWSLTGTPDGFGSPWSSVAVTAAVGFGITALFAAFAIFDIRPDHQAPAHRLLAGSTWFVVAMMCALTTTTFLQQIGAADASDAPNVLPILAMSLATGFAGAVLASVAVSDPSAQARPADPRELSPAQTVQWFGTARRSRADPSLALFALVLGAFSAFGLTIAATGGSSWWLQALLLAIGAVSLPAMLELRVRIDARGLLVRSPIGFPRIHIRLDEIEGVEELDVNPVASYGKLGWSTKLALPEDAAAIRKGRALRVGRRDRTPLVVTVDDAGTAAAVLEAQLAAERHG